jgi:hypothetical protein
MTEGNSMIEISRLKEIENGKKFGGTSLTWINICICQLASTFKLRISDAILQLAHSWRSGAAI